MDLTKHFAITFWVRDREDYIVELGKFTLPGWSGHAMWYLFECPNCNELDIDYLHGHRLHLVCHGCDARWTVRQNRFYIQTGMPPLPTWWQEQKMLWQLAKRYKRAGAKVVRGDGFDGVKIPDEKEAAKVLATHVATSARANGIPLNPKGED